MKKLLALILVLVLAASVVACGGNGGGTAGTDGSAPAGELKGEVTVWCWDPNFNIPAMTEAARIYNAINPDAVINIVETPWDQVQDALTAAATTGVLDNIPDIFLMQDMAFQRNVMTFPELFIDLTNTGIDFGQFAAGKRGFSTVDGKNFGVPFDNGATIYAVRTDVLEQAGYTVADVTDVTWSQFISVGKDVLAQTGMPMLSTTAGGGDFIMVMLQSAGVDLFNADGSPNIAGNPVLISAIETYLELVDTGVLLEVNGWDEYIDSFVNDNVVGTISGCWILGSVQENAHAGAWAVTNIPRLEVAGGTNFSSWGGSSWAVTNVGNSALAVDFLKHTFAGSVELYETILPSTGAIGTWAPAAASSVYAEPHPFFGGQAVFADIVGFAGKIPQINVGVYFYTANDNISIAVSNIINNGADITTELQAAQEATEFAIME
ncbi:MAG: extracellular solute-binding protein [Oscillospiraceae bacterium]|nr:extracellular solute-binding protein [Oscillospiraceae bacterium]